MLWRASMIICIVFSIFDKLLHAINTIWHPLLPGSKPWGHKALEVLSKHGKSFCYCRNFFTVPVEACPVIQATETVQKDAWSTMLTDDIGSWFKLKGCKVSNSSLFIVTIIFARHCVGTIKVRKMSFRNVNIVLIEYS